MGGMKKLEVHFERFYFHSLDFDGALPPCQALAEALRIQRNSPCGAAGRRSETENHICAGKESKRGKREVRGGAPRPPSGGCPGEEASSCDEDT